MSSNKLTTKRTGSLNALYREKYKYNKLKDKEFGVGGNTGYSSEYTFSFTGRGHEELIVGEEEKDLLEELNQPSNNAFSTVTTRWDFVWCADGKEVIPDCNYNCVTLKKGGQVDFGSIFVPCDGTVVSVESGKYVGVCPDNSNGTIVIEDGVGTLTYSGQDYTYSQVLNKSGASFSITKPGTPSTCSEKCYFVDEVETCEGGFVITYSVWCDDADGVSYCADEIAAYQECLDRKEIWYEENEIRAGKKSEPLTWETGCIEVCDASANTYKITQGSTPGSLVVLDQTRNTFHYINADGQIEAVGAMAKSGNYREDGANSFSCP